MAAQAWPPSCALQREEREAITRQQANAGAATTSSRTLCIATGNATGDSAATLGTSKACQGLRRSPGVVDGSAVQHSAWRAHQYPLACEFCPPDSLAKDSPGRVEYERSQHSWAACYASCHDRASTGCSTAHRRWGNCDQERGVSLHRPLYVATSQRCTKHRAHSQLPSSTTIQIGHKEVLIITEWYCTQLRALAHTHLHH